MVKLVLLAAILISSASALIEMQTIQGFDHKNYVLGSQISQKTSDKGFKFCEFYPNEAKVYTYFYERLLEPMYAEVTEHGSEL